MEDEDVVSLQEDFKLEPPVYDLPIRVLDETPEYFVIDKHSSIPVKPCGVYYKNTLYNSLENLYDCHLLPKQQSALPRSASGVMFLQKTNALFNKNEIILKTTRNGLVVRESPSIGHLTKAYARVGGRIVSNLMLSWHDYSDSRFRKQYLDTPDLHFRINVVPVSYSGKTNTSLIEIFPTHEEQPDH